MRVWLGYGILVSAAAATLLAAQLSDVPQGMYCGGNRLFSEGHLKGSGVAGTVFDPAGEPVPKARVQVEMQARDRMVKDFAADDKGRFRLKGLHEGEYWLGVSAPGYNLHYWHLTVSHSFGEAAVQLALSPGT